MRYLMAGALALAMSLSAYAQTTPPAPSITVGAIVKGLRFDWEPVPGASRYELEYKANQNASFVRLGDILTSSATSFSYRFPLHLFNWTYARYRLAACNATGCSRSSEVSVSDLRTDAPGYFQPATLAQFQAFGAELDISPDGLNFAVATWQEADNPSAIGAVYVYRRGSNGVWQQRTRLVPPMPGVVAGEDYFKSVSISADGNTVVVGMPNYFREWLDEELYDDVSGEVYIFHFDGITWVRSRLYAGAGARGSFGNWVSISDAGDLIAVASGESYQPTIARHVYLYRLINGSWQPVRGFATTPNDLCEPNALSGDGSTLAQACLVYQGPPAASTPRRLLRIWSGPNWTAREEVPLEIEGAATPAFIGSGLSIDRTGDTIAAHILESSASDQNATGKVQVQVFHRDGGYRKVASLSPGTWRNNFWYGEYGRRLSLSGDGSTLAVSDSLDNGYGTGPRAAPLNPTTNATGAIYIYRLRDTWLLANMIKGNSLSGGTGGAIALNGNGHSLVASGAPKTPGPLGAGAVFLY